MTPPTTHNSETSFFRLRSSVGIAGAVTSAPSLSRIWDVYRELDRTQWLSADELEQRQLQQLRVLVRHCAEQVPYYRRVLSEAGVLSRPLESLADFQKFPLLTRELYQRHSAELQAEQLPSGLKVVSSSFTSGTSGVPIQVRTTNQDGQWWNALYLRDLEWGGIDPRGRLAAIRLIAKSVDTLPAALAGLSSPAWTQVGQLLFESGPSFGMDIRQDPRRQLDWLERIEPSCLLSMSTNLEFLANLLLETGRRLPSLKVIQAVGEPLTSEARQRIESAFGVPVKNLYSTTETGYVASDCPLGHGLHVHGESVLTEVLDADGQPCLPGQSGRLVITSLHNFVNPFLRYEMLDDVTLAPGPCPCGRGLPLWKHVEGRRHPFLFLPDGRRKSSIGMTIGLRQVGGCHQFQFVQRAVDRVLLRVVPDPTWTADHAERMRAVVRREMESEAVQVEVAERPFLERPPGGKLKMILVELEM